MKRGKLFKNKYRKDTLRMQGFDYSSDGNYFITICVEGRKCSFGDIYREKMCVNELGSIVHYVWKLIPEYFPHVILDEFVVMPDHVHGIVGIRRFVIYHESPDCQRALRKNILKT